MRYLLIGISSALLFALAGCSSLGEDGKRIDYGAASKRAPTLEVPPDLTVPTTGDRFRIPQGDDASVATFSEYSQGSAMPARSAVLPELQWVKLERDGTQRRLVVRDTPDNVWQVVKAFWQENGLTLRSEEPDAGLMETEWAENRAMRKSAAIEMPGQAYDSAHSAGTRDQYRTRLERSTDGAATGIYITHAGIREEQAGLSTRWVARANDPELEAIMLQRLMLRLGAGEAQAAEALAAAPVAAPASADSSIEPAGMASLREVSGNLVIVVNDPFDRAWRKAGLAIEHANLSVEDKDREKGIYYLRPIKVERGFWASLKFWQGDEDTERQYRVNVKDGGTTCEITVTDQNGASTKASRQMLEALYNNINKQ